MTIRDATRADFLTILELNDKSVAETSPLDERGLAALAAQSDCFKVHSQGGAVTAFLIALRENARYENVNFRWFCERYPRFIYIDRIVVAPDRRGAGIGAALYEDVERHARDSGIDMLACEVNVQPENQPSLEFHRNRGFVEVGTQSLPTQEKVVAMLVLHLSRGSTSCQTSR
jgi:predicted GNAT superfamily acetyltransferase